MASLSPNTIGRPERIESMRPSPMVLAIEALARGTGYKILSAVGDCLTIAPDEARLDLPKNHRTMSVADFRKLPRTPEAVAA